MCGRLLFFVCVGVIVAALVGYCGAKFIKCEVNGVGNTQNFKVQTKGSTLTVNANTAKMVLRPIVNEGFTPDEEDRCWESPCETTSLINEPVDPSISCGVEKDAGIKSVRLTGSNDKTVATFEVANYSSQLRHPILYDGLLYRLYLEDSCLTNVKIEKASTEDNGVSETTQLTEMKKTSDENGVVVDCVSRAGDNTGARGDGVAVIKLDKMKDMNPGDDMRLNCSHLEVTEFHIELMVESAVKAVAVFANSGDVKFLGTVALGEFDLVMRLGKSEKTYAREITLTKRTTRKKTGKSYP